MIKQILKPVTSNQKFHSNGDQTSDPLAATAAVRKHYDKEKYSQQLLIIVNKHYNDATDTTKHKHLDCPQLGSLLKESVYPYMC